MNASAWSAELSIELNFRATSRGYTTLFFVRLARAVAS